MTARASRRSFVPFLACLSAACARHAAPDAAPVPAGYAQSSAPAALHAPEPSEASGAPRPEEPAALSAEAAALRRPADLAQRLARDERLSFPASVPERARRELEAGLPLARERGIALVALGAAGSLQDRARIEASATAAPEEEREAAILALGEIGDRGTSALQRLAAPGLEPEPGVEAPSSVPALESALELALLRARGEGTPAALAAWPDADAVTRLLEWRWDAAQRYGLVDGIRWQAWRTEELLDDRVFLLRTVLGAAPLLDRALAADHVLQILLEDEAPERIPAIVAFMPEEVSDLVTSGRWLPAGPDEWGAVLRTIETERLERRMVDLLLFASGLQELLPQVVPLLVRAGEPAPEEWLAEQLQDPDPARVVQLVEALAEGTHIGRVPELWQTVTRSEHLDVAAAALVSLARLGDATSSAALEERLAAGEGEARDATILAVARAAHDPRMRAVLSKLVARGAVGPDLELEVDLALARTGPPRDMALVRGWLAPTFAVEVRRTAIRALAGRPGETDLALLHGLFPIDGEQGLNVELAVALIRHRDPLARGLLRRVLWEGRWNLSLLAGGLLLGEGGPHFLQDELEAPPEGAGQRDRRRVGFALGLWGGIEVVEALAKRRSESDPVLQGAFLGVLSARHR